MRTIDEIKTFNKQLAEMVRCLKAKTPSGFKNIEADEFLMAEIKTMRGYLPIIESLWIDRLDSLHKPPEPPARKKPTPTPNPTDPVKGFAE
jgi:hypothetical protein